MKRYLLWIVFLITNTLSGICVEPDIEALLKEIDENKNFLNNDFTGTYTIIQDKVDEGTSYKQAKFFRRDSEDKMVILLLKPEINKGEGYFQAEGNLWFYDPESRKFTHTSSKENFHDTDAKNSDFRKSSFAEDYDVEGYTEGKLGQYDVYIVDLAANNNEVTYPFLKLWIRKDINIILKIEDYSLTRRLMRTELFPNYIQTEGKYIPSKMIFIDEITVGNKTQILLEDVSLADLPDSVFTKSFIERVNR
jgi:hypothetical protein